MVTRRVETGHCPVAGTDRLLQYLGSTETFSGYDIDVYECQVCSAIIHVPQKDGAPFKRHRKTDCRTECLDMQTDRTYTRVIPSHTVC
jgi:hypothetical protein